MAVQVDPQTRKVAATGRLPWNFACTTLLSAFLLFQVQPLVSKCILPWFGGAPSVWTTCMLFFQTLLFGGYLYAHLLQRYLPLRRQAAVHVLLVLAAAAMLPIAPGAEWKPADGSAPIARILILLTVTVGLPYFVLSATSPLVQAWFSRSCPGRSPYRLYALSNFGSLAALLTYPFLFEPALELRQQSLLWSGSFLIYLVLCAACSLYLRRLPGQPACPVSWVNWRAEGDSPIFMASCHKNWDSPQQPARASSAAEPGGEGVDPCATAEAPTLLRRLLWLALPACASLMLLATTNHVCQDVAVVPLLWVVPLSLYLLSFIICFDHSRWYHRGVWATAAAVCTVAVALLSTAHYGLDIDFAKYGFSRLGTFQYSLDIVQQLVICFATLFFACMVCHGELTRLKPDPRHLTEFYLLIAAGGAVGGGFVSLLAPLIFTAYIEWPIGLALCFLVATTALWLGSRPENLRRSPRLAAVAWRLGYHDRRIRWLVNLMLVVPAALGMCAMIVWQPLTPHVIHRARNFYGMVWVMEEGGVRYLMHGWITHGCQFVDAEKRTWATTYYSEQSGVGQAIHYFRRRGKVRVGAVGLGTGTLAAYAQQGDEYRFYEINPQVPRIARTYFTFLADCQRRGGRCPVIMGDARLSLERELAQDSPQPSHQFHVLVLDAFSSDAIPGHLLTREAFDVYQRHLAPEGVIAVHISNRCLDLAPVVRGLAHYYGLTAIRVASVADKRREVDAADWYLLTRNADFAQAVPSQPPDGAKDESTVPLWTDQYSNLFRILRTGKAY